MKEWKEILSELEKKLTPLFAFVVLVVIVIALLGSNIPDGYRILIYAVVIGGLVIYAAPQFLQILAKYRPEPPRSLPAPATPSSSVPALVLAAPDPFDARERYLRAVIKDCSAVRLAGLDPNASDPNRGGMSLEKLYVSLDTQTPHRLLEREREPLGALEAWVGSEKRCMVLLGLPGTGKSTFIRYLALTMARAANSPEAQLPPGWEGRPLLPFMLSLGRFAETLPPGCARGRAEQIETYLVQSLENDDAAKNFAPLTLRVLEREGALVMFDGLDEVADLALRPLVVQAVEDFVEKYGRNPSNHFLVTCRTYSYQHDAAWKLTGWPTHELALLDRKKIEYFIRAWYAELAQIEPARRDEYVRKRDELLKTLAPGDRRRLLEIATFPLILTIMAVVHTHYGDLPDTRAEVYERCVELLLIRWQGERSAQGRLRKQSILDALDAPPTVLYQALWEVAYRAHGEAKKESGAAALVTEDLLDGVLKVYLQERDKVETFLEYCRSSNGLLMLQGTLSVPGRPPRKLYAFPHLTFEEYLAARYLADLDPAGYAYDLAGRSDRWREAIKLLGEHLCFGSPQRPTMSALLDALADPPASASQEERARMTWLAGDLLVLYRRAFPSKPAPADATIFARLRELALAPLPDPRLRADCADLADELSYRPPDLYDFVELGVNGDGVKNRPPSTLRRLFIAKYPVTNLQYERFLTPENFADRSLWMDFPQFDENRRSMEKTSGGAGWDWLRETLKDPNAALDGKTLLPRYWRDPRFGAARKTAPVVGVTWWEANAYCRWLSRHWQEQPEAQSLSSFILPNSPFTFRLPTEAEWVAAAGGAGENHFAWGALQDEKEITRFANTAESDIGRTTPVWTYPQGASSLGVMDLSGNVWEWQANFYDKDHDYLGLRGGSWYGPIDNARVADRNLYHPDYQWDGGGFRLVVGFPHPR